MWCIKFFIELIVESAINGHLPRLVDEVGTIIFHEDHAYITYSYIPGEWSITITILLVILSHTYKVIL